ncbi:MAG: hypothetical protein J6U86_05470, partial [Clostridia bacterium]|nr:hypothetical protein [Clostridia bacterium]
QRPTMTLSAQNARRVSDSEIPIAEGKSESLKSRQIQSELYTKRSGGFSNMTAEEYLSGFGASARSKNEQRVPEVKVAEKVASKVQEPEPEKPSENTAEPPRSAVVEEKISKSENHSTEPLTDNLKVPAKALAQTEVKEEKRLSYRIIGEAFNSYVMVECGNTIIIIDKHAAHERIIFEQLKRSMRESTQTTSQLLMLPLEIMMTSDEIQALVEYKAEIEATGFEFSAGRHTLNVSAVPQGISVDAVTDMLTIMADRIKSNTGGVALTRDMIFEKALYQASCKAAVKAGREYPPEYIEWIVEKLMELPDITVCPHGRPVAIELTKTNLNYQFERS